MKYFLMPGDLAASLLSLQEGSEHRQLFRMFANTVVWSLVGVLVAFYISL